MNKEEEQHHKTHPPKQPTMTSSTAALLPTHKKLKLLPLIFLIFFEVSGGPYGSEPAVRAAGPLLSILGFLIFPFIWSIPEALITAELATAMPGNGGFVLWADRAFGSFAGSMMGSLKFLSGSINSAAYPVLCADYLSKVLPALEKGLPRVLTVVGASLGLSVVNYAGLTIVGYLSMVLCIVSIMPFVLMSCWAVPKITVGRWGKVGKDKDWRTFFNSLFWNLNFWDNASTLAGEVDRPQKTFPKALLGSGILTILGYIVPLMAVTGALDLPQEAWEDGFYADAAGIIVGKWLKYWLEIGAILSAIGLYEAQLSSTSFQLLGMADLGFLPRVFASRSKWFNTPWLGILTSSLITLAISFLSFTDIIASANFLYSLGMLLELSSFLWLRKKHPNLKRPFRVPMEMKGLICMCLVPSIFLIFVMALASWKVVAISAGMTVFGVFVYYFMKLCNGRGWLKFSVREVAGEEEEEVLSATRYEA